MGRKNNNDSTISLLRFLYRDDIFFTKSRTIPHNRNIGDDIYLIGKKKHPARYAGQAA